jgi:uncharacterized membrane protein
MHVVNIQKSDTSNSNAYYLLYVLTGFYNILVDAMLCHNVISEVKKYKYELILGMCIVITAVIIIRGIYLPNHMLLEVSDHTVL